MNIDSLTHFSQEGVLAAPGVSRVFVEDLIAENKALQALLKVRDETIENVEKTVANLKAQIEWLMRQFFGKKSERLDPSQTLLAFEYLAAQTAAQEEVPVADVQADILATSSKVNTRATRAPSITSQASLERLPVLDTETILPDEVQENPSAYTKISEEVSLVLLREPGKIGTRKIIREKYIRNDAGKTEKEDAPVIAPFPKHIVEGGNVSDELVIDIANSKYLMHLPLYRQQQAIEREFGVRIPRQTMCDWMKSLADLCHPVYAKIKEEILRCGYVQMDETPVRYIDGNEKHGSTKQGYFWVLNNPRGDVYFHWHPGRHSEQVGKLLGETYSGIIQSDAYAAYESYIKSNPRATWLCCWAHARRNFHNAYNNGAQPHARPPLERIGQLYALERDWNDADARAHAERFSTNASAIAPAREEALADDEESFWRERQALRRRQRMEHFPDILRNLRDSAAAAAKQGAPDGHLVKAEQYLVNHWRALCRVMWHGRTFLDNNRVENALRPCALGRKNWLFIGHVDAGDRSAILYTLFCGAKRHGHNPVRYLRSITRALLERGNQADLLPLLPSNWQDTHA